LGEGLTGRGHAPSPVSTSQVATCNPHSKAFGRPLPEGAGAVRGDNRR
ncbi:MAG: hypothetical protein PWR21_45, partial [Methanoculleus sp.]|nr:hypothetical protein [Methanoculleus sp.]